MATFSEMIKSGTPLLVDFFATWCGPCKIMSPILDEVKGKVGESVTIIKVDVDKNPSAAEAYNVMGVPTLILFKNGEVKWRQSGVVQASQLERILKSHV